MVTTLTGASASKFRMRCPKCNSKTGDGNFKRANNFSALSKRYSLVYGCFMCGTRIYGQAVEDEYRRQLDLWENPMRTPHPALLAPYKAPERALTLPSKRELARAYVERGDPAHIPDMDPEYEQGEWDLRPVATSVATTVRTDIRCGEFGYWCHDTCHRHARCMYLPRPQVSKTSDGKCSNTKCDNNAAPNSKYCSKACMSRQSSRNSYLRKKSKKDGAEVS